MANSSFLHCTIFNLFIDRESRKFSLSFHLFLENLKNKGFAPFLLNIDTLAGISTYFLNKKALLYLIVDFNIALYMYVHYVIRTE